MRPILKLVLVPILFMFAGCATIVSGTTQKISVSTQPSGAEAKADGITSIRTPGHLTLDRKSEHTIVFAKEGYKTATVFIRKTFNEMASGNILVGGIIGVGIDAASGSGNKLIPERIDIILEPGEGYSEKTKFTNQKDQDYYDNIILKAQITADQKQAEKEAEKARKEAAMSGTNQVSPGPTTNFGPKAA